MTSVDIIVPTFNGIEYLSHCLDSLRLSTLQDFQLIVFDDGSTQAIEPAVRSRFPNAMVLRSTRNIGLTRGFNAAIAAGSAPFVVLLNNDTEVDPVWLEHLLLTADRHPEAGSVASKILLMSDRAKLHSAGDTWSVRGMPVNRGVWQDDLGQFDCDESVFSGCGAAVLYRRSALNAVRLSNGSFFDERLFMYCEDVDLGWRLQLAGRQCVFAPAARVHHHLSASGGGRLASYFVARNVWLLVARTIPVEFTAPFKQRIAAYHAGRIARTLPHLREPAARANLRGSRDGLRTWFRERRRQPHFHGGSDEYARIAGLLADDTHPRRH
jgi:GT2 family glycosyltransferase